MRSLVAAGHAGLGAIGGFVAGDALARVSAEGCHREAGAEGVVACAALAFAGSVAGGSVGVAVGALETADALAEVGVASLGKGAGHGAGTDVGGVHADVSRVARVAAGVARVVLSRVVVASISRVTEAHGGVGHAGFDTLRVGRELAAVGPEVVAAGDE